MGRELGRPGNRCAAEGEGTTNGYSLPLKNPIGEDISIKLAAGRRMATKTISLELDAYEKLKMARRSEHESFSEVVRRARWDVEPSTGPKILAHLSELRARHPASLLPDEVLDQMDERARPRTARGERRQTSQ